MIIIIITETIMTIAYREKEVGTTIAAQKEELQ